MEHADTDPAPSPDNTRIITPSELTDLKVEASVWDGMPINLTRLANLLLMAFVPIPQLFLWLLLVNFVCGWFNYWFAPPFHSFIPFLTRPLGKAMYALSILLSGYFILKGQWWMVLYIWTSFIFIVFLWFPRMAADRFYATKYGGTPEEIYIKLRMRALGLRHSNDSEQKNPET